MAEIIKLTADQINREQNDKAFYRGQRKKDSVDLGLSPSTIIIEIIINVTLVVFEYI